MSGGPAQNGAAAGRARDYYTEFIEGSRWLSREQAVKRMDWFEDLEQDEKYRLLFEFEMMLKGLVCFGSPLNHPGAAKKGPPASARYFTEELKIARAIATRAIESGNALLGGARSPLVFRRYLDSVIARGASGAEIADQPSGNGSPGQSLSSLIFALESLVYVFDGALKASEITFSSFSSMIRLAEREIHRSAYFNPLPALEFRVEFDEIYPLEMLTTIRGIKNDPARKVASLVFLSMTRMLKYVDWIVRLKSSEVDPLAVFGWLAVMRSDARALCVFVKRYASPWISSGFFEQFATLDPAGINARMSELEADFATLKSLKELLGSLCDQLGLEQRKMFELRLPSVDSIGEMDDLLESAADASVSMRAYFQNAMALLAAEFDTKLNGSTLFPDLIPEETRLERLRRDIWMFQQVLRAFIEKAMSSAAAADKWSSTNTFQFVRQFVRYFRSMGYQLVRYSDYRQFDEFIHLVDRLRGGDVLEVQRFERVVESCRDFQVYLDLTFDDVDNREELKDKPFDRKDAARTLKLFLTH